MLRSVLLELRWPISRTPDVGAGCQQCVLSVLAQVAQMHSLYAGATWNRKTDGHRQAALRQLSSAIVCCACAEVTRDDVELGDEDLDAGAWGDPDLDLDVGEPGEANGAMDADHEEAEEGEEGEGGWEMEVCTAHPSPYLGCSHRLRCPTSIPLRAADVPAVLQLIVLLTRQLPITASQAATCTQGIPASMLCHGAACPPAL